MPRASRAAQVFRRQLPPGLVDVAWAWLWAALLLTALLGRQWVEAVVRLVGLVYTLQLGVTDRRLAEARRDLLQQRALTSRLAEVLNQRQEARRA